MCFQTPTADPNYFGELLLWWGVYISSVVVFTDYMHIAVISPLFITFLLLFLSGMPLLEKSADKRFHKDPAYLEYKGKTSPLLPFPPRWWKALPSAVKLVLFEWPIYNYLDDPNVEANGARIEKVEAGAKSANGSHNRPPPAAESQKTA